MTDLTTTEATRLASLEQTIEQGLKTFVEVGNALLEIRDSRLYRDSFGTFEDYCRERWGMERAQAYRLIDASRVVNNLSPIGDKIPVNEAQARPLSKLSPQLQREVWPIVVETAPNGKITAEHVQRVVDNATFEHTVSVPEMRLVNTRDAVPLQRVCAECGQVYDGESCPDCQPRNDYNYKRDNRRSVAADIYTPLGMDACQTPAYALDPLLPFLRPDWTIWEPACGEGLLVEALYDAGFKEGQVIGSDILVGQNFFQHEPDNWDCIVTNPPYSIQFEWLERCYQLGEPFALLLKVEVLGTKTAQEMFDRFGVEVIFVSPRINFKMPHKGWDGGGAQFPTAWFTWGLNIGRQISFARINVQSS